MHFFPINWWPQRLMMLIPRYQHRYSIDKPCWRFIRILTQRNTWLVSCNGGPGATLIMMLQEKHQYSSIKLRKLSRKLNNSPLTHKPWSPQWSPVFVSPMAPSADLVALKLHSLTSSFPHVVITATTRGRCLTANVDMGCVKLLAGTTYTAMFVARMGWLIHPYVFWLCSLSFPGIPSRVNCAGTGVSN